MVRRPSTFGATEPGGYTVQARVKTVTSQIQIAYRNPDTSDGLQIWSINPREGSYAGGEQVVLTGKGIANPVEVYFTVQGTQYQAIVDSGGPERSGIERRHDHHPDSTSDVRPTPASRRPPMSEIAVEVGTTDEQSQTYPSVFTYISDCVIHR